MDPREAARIFISIFLFIFCINLTFASVEVFSDYSTTLTVNTDNTLNVNKSLTLKNVYDVGIVPGQIEFKIGQGTQGSIGQVEITNVEAYDAYGNSINTQIRNTQDYSVIILDIYYPLLPGFEYEFDVNYELTYEPGGIFFKSLQVPIRESTIPIEKGEFKVNIPENYHFTYLNADGGNVSIQDGMAVWSLRDDSPKSIEFEYSYLPVNIGGFQGSYVFWILINVLLLGFLFFEVRKEIKRVRKKYGE